MINDDDESEASVDFDYVHQRFQADSPQQWPVCGGEINSEHLAVPSRWLSAG